MTQTEFEEKYLTEMQKLELDTFGACDHRDYRKMLYLACMGKSHISADIEGIYDDVMAKIKKESE